MRLEDLTIALRPRENWEAVDLGCSLVRRDFGRLLGLWSATVLPLWAAMAAMLGNRPAVFMLLVWWLKPLYDRVPLYYISRAAFGERPTMWEAMKAWPRLWTRFPFSALLFRRLSLIRSFALPVWLLEGQRGKAVRQRVRALATDGGGAGFKVTSVFLTFELGILIGLWAMSYNIAPDSGLPEFWDFIVSASNLSDGSTLEVPLFFQWYLITLYLVSLTLVELFYVGAGFGLYLNTRTKLEGWDIELTFRKLAARLRAAALTALIIVGSVIMAEAKSESDHPLAGVEASAPAANPAKKSIQDILAKPEFEIHTRIQKVPVPRHSDSRSVPPVPWLGTVLKLIAWLIVAGLLGLLIWWLVQNRHLFRFSRHGRVKPSVPGPRVVMGMEISRESLPEDLLQTARDAWQRGDLRAALSLLYRGALSRLVEQKRLPIRDSDTEDDCLTHVRKACERPIADYFGRLTRLWEGAAYAGMEAGAADFDFLCSAWPFDGAGTERPGRHRAILLFLLGLSLWSLGACEYREEKITTGYQGKARSDPFLAAQQLLGDYDHDAKKVTSLSKLPEDPEDAVIVISGESGMSEGRARQLLQWAAGGGHVIYALAGCRPYNDWSIFSTFSNIAYFGNEEREDALLKSLGITLDDTRVNLHELGKDAQKEAKPKDEKTDAGPPNKKDESPTAPGPKKDDDETGPKSAEEILITKNDVAWRSQVFHVEMPSYVTFKLNRKLALDEFSAGPLDKATALGLRHGAGRITLLNHARPFRNRYIGDADHAAWLLALAGEYPQNVMFVLALEGSFWTLLWSKGWMVMAGIGALTVFWLWRNLPRFGPARHVELHETKHFVEHVSALGQFFHAFRRNDILLTAAADAVRTRAFRRFPQLSGSGDAALISVLAERSHLPEERIRTALSPPASHPPHSLVRILHDLQTLRQALA